MENQSPKPGNEYRARIRRAKNAKRAGPNIFYPNLYSAKQNRSKENARRLKQKELLK